MVPCVQTHSQAKDVQTGSQPKHVEGEISDKVCVQKNSQVKGVGGMCGMVPGVQKCDQTKHVEGGMSDKVCVQMSDLGGTETKIELRKNVQGGKMLPVMGGQVT